MTTTKFTARHARWDADMNAERAAGDAAKAKADVLTAELGRPVHAEPVWSMASSPRILRYQFVLTDESVPVPQPTTQGETA